MLLAGFLAGWASLIVSSACCALQMSLSGAIPLRIGLTTMVGYHTVVGIFEGMLTAGVLSFLLKVRPDLMKLNDLGRFGAADWVGATLFVAIPAAILVLAGSSRLPDPLERLLAITPLLSGGTEPAKLNSTARYLDYLVRAGVFVLLVLLGFVASLLGRHRRRRP
jgi:cobalt/nickel transport system permease protein